jgi:hypothetical protein
VRFICNRRQEMSLLCAWRGSVKVLVCKCYSFQFSVLWVSYKHKNSLPTWIRRETLATYVLWSIRHSDALKEVITLNTGCDRIDYPESNINGI